MAALGRPFSGLPLSGGSDFLQPPPAFAGRAFPPGTEGAEVVPRPGLRATPSSSGGSAARGRISTHCRKKHKREEEDDEEYRMSADHLLICPVMEQQQYEKIWLALNCCFVILGFFTSHLTFPELIVQ
ncbi:coiled-coil domain-containing protein 117 isoform X3 [Muntiacus reevesi]|uniref:coiled-coil domain-containing protein 117 isoform X3 n=1 Tax=Muntiacus reevesi TaxID=9886 RepID=UPI003306D508